MRNTAHFQSIPLALLEEDSRNSNVCDLRTLKKLTGNIRKTGLCPALVVRPHPERSDRYILIDGHHRYRILRDLNWEKAPCQILDVSDAEAQLLLATLNRLRGEDNPRKRALLVDSLRQHFDPDALCQLIPESSQEVEDLLALLKKEEEAAEKQLKEAMKAEEAQLPVVLNYVVLQSDVALIEKVIRHFTPAGSDDPGGGLTALCRKAWRDLGEGDERTEEAGEQAGTPESPGCGEETYL